MHPYVKLDIPVIPKVLRCLCTYPPTTVHKLYYQLGDNALGSLTVRGGTFDRKMLGSSHAHLRLGLALT